MIDDQWVRTGRYIEALLKEKGGTVSIRRERDVGLLFSHSTEDGKEQNFAWWPDTAGVRRPIIKGGTP